MNFSRMMTMMLMTGAGAELPAVAGVPVALLLMAGFALAVAAVFYLINQMRPWGRVGKMRLVVCLMDELLMT